MTTARDKREPTVEYEALEIGVVEAMAFSIAFALAEAVLDGVLTAEQKHGIAGRVDEFLHAMQTGSAVTSTGEGHYKIVPREEINRDDKDDNLIIGG